MSIDAGQIVTADDLALLAPAIARKTSTQTVNNSTTFVNDTALTLPVLANTVYKAHLYLCYNSAAIPDLKFQWSVPSGTTLTNWYFAAGNTANWQTLVLPSGAVSAINGTASDAPCNAWGIVVVGSTAGSMTLQWAQNTANASNTDVKAGSFFELTRVQ
jgi:hypothetical protein